jgi:hypothetical protein
VRAFLRVAFALSPIRPENGDCDDGNRHKQQPAQTSHGGVKISLTDARWERRFRLPAFTREVFGQSQNAVCAESGARHFRGML